MKKFLLALLWLAACGKDNPSPSTQPATDQWQLQEVKVAYNPGHDNPLEVYGYLRKGSDAYVFGFQGPLQENSRLTSPILDDQQSTLHCLRADCREFEVPVKMKVAALPQPIHVQLLPVASAQSHLDAAGDDANAPLENHRRIWREFLRAGADPAHSFLARATYQTQTFLTVALNNVGATRYLVLNGPTVAGPGKVGYDITLGPEMQFLTGYDLGGLAPVTDNPNRVLIYFSGGMLDLGLTPAR